MAGPLDFNFTTPMRNIAMSLANQKMQSPMGLSGQPQTANSLLPNAAGLATPTNDQRSNMAPADTFLKQMGRLLGGR